MRITTTALLLLAACATASGAAGQVPPVAKLFVSPMGEPFRGGDLDPADRWFAGVDADRDVRLTPAEMRADALRWFGLLDSDRDGEITPPEIDRYETELVPEVRIARDLKVDDTPRRRRSRAALMSRDTDVQGESARMDARRGAARYGYLDLPQPVASADRDLNRGITPAEFAATAALRFALLDRDADGALTRDELHAARLRPAPR